MSWRNKLFIFSKRFAQVPGAMLTLQFSKSLLLEQRFNFKKVDRTIHVFLKVGF